MYKERLGYYGEERPQGDLIKVHKYLIQDVKMMEPDPYQCCPVTGQVGKDTD